MWFFLSITGYFLLAIVTILDKLILTKSIGKPIVYTFYSTIFLLPTLLLWPFGIAPPPAPGLDLALAFVSSMLFGLGYWTLFVSLKTGEASHIEPFIGAIVTIVSYVLGGICLGEVLTHAQVAGVVILIFASFLLSFEKSRKHHGIHIGFFWAIISGVCFGTSLIASKYLYDHYSFPSAIVWTRGLTGLFGIFLLLSSTVRKAIAKPKKSIPLRSYGKRYKFIIILFNKIFAVTGIILVNYAIAIGSVTIINALAGIQFILLFIIIYICTKFFPKIFKEYFTKRELVVETIAIVLVAIGSIFFVF